MTSSGQPPQAPSAESSWLQAQLGEIVTLQRGFDLPSKERVPGPFSIVSSSGVTGFHNEYKVNGPGVVTGRYGTLGEVFYQLGQFWPLNTTLYVRDFKGNEPRYVFYLLQSLDFSVYSDKSSVPGLNRNHLHQIKVNVPSLPEQRAIAHILGTLDDKIELNRQMNQTLEEMAAALFRSWFIDFDPVRAKMAGREPEGMDAATAALFPERLVESEVGEIPEGWRIEPLDQIATFLNGLAMQKYPADGDAFLPVIKIAQLRKGDTEGADRASLDVPADYVVKDGDVLFSWSGSLEVEIWAGGTGALNQHLFKVTSADFPKWFYLEWTRHHLPRFREIARDKATTMGHIQRRHLREATVVIPPPDCLRRLTEIMAPLIEASFRNSVSSKTLTALRDTLLPRLLSGELRVPAAGA